MKVRLITYKSFRHYGGREITSKAHSVLAKLVAQQDSYQKYIVELLEDVEDGATYEKGRRVAVPEKNYNI